VETTDAARAWLVLSLAAVSRGRVPEGQVFLLECLWPGVTEETVARAAARLRRTAAALSETREHVRFLGSQLVPADEVAFFELEAGSAEVVREIGLMAQIPFERVVRSVRVPACREARTPTGTRGTAGGGST
jgi:hypothetical protein